MTTQYGIILQARHDRTTVGSMDGEYTVATLDGALQLGFNHYKNGDEVMNIFEYDPETGDVNQHKNRQELSCLYHSWIVEDERLNREEARYGSYYDQHHQRLSDVI